MEARNEGKSGFVFAQKARLAEGWARNVRIEIGADGAIIAIEKNAQYRPDQDGDAIPVLIPAMPGVHSHLHQRATIVGHAEKLDPAQPENTFWEWRDQMYGGMKNITPEQFAAIAKKLYADYLRAGYSAVGEFHYILNQGEKEGYKPYPDPNRLAGIAIDAAKAVGIGITMMPALYRYGNFGEKAFTRPEQQRFYSETESYLGNVESLMDTYKGEPNVNIGIALHSLRAVSEKDLEQVFSTDWVVKGHFPIHMHIAEQAKEVADCVAHSRRTPVELLYDFLGEKVPGFDVSRLVLIHATHMTEAETRRVADAGSVICFCPTTEANLGDGILPHTQAYIRWGGKLSIGPDQNGVINPFQELYLLDAENRLLHRKRIATGLSGDELWERAAQGGAQAIGMNAGVAAVGMRADFVTLDPEAITNFSSLADDRILDAAILNPAQDYPVENVMVLGKWVVRKGVLQAPDGAGISEAYETALAEIHARRPAQPKTQ